MYNIHCILNEEEFDFTTPAIHPFQAVKIFQEATKVFDKVEMLSLKKEECLRIF